MKTIPGGYRMMKLTEMKVRKILRQLTQYSCKNQEKIQILDGLIDAVKIQIIKLKIWMWQTENPVSVLSRICWSGSWQKTFETLVTLSTSTDRIKFYRNVYISRRSSSYRDVIVDRLSGVGNHSWTVHHPIKSIIIYEYFPTYNHK